MKVCFLHTELTYPPEQIELQRALAVRMVKSVKQKIGCEVIQMTDPLTPPVVGVDSCHRTDQRGKYWIEFQMGMMAAQTGDVVFLDTDCVVLHDISWIFDEEFDLVLSVKPGRGVIYTDDNGVKHQMPWTGGVIFSRCPQFWIDNLERTMTYEDEKVRGWWGAAMGFGEYLKVCPYKIKFIDSFQFNYAPGRPDEDLSGKYVVHYKGRRKTWNLPGEWPELPENRVIAVKFA